MVQDLGFIGSANKMQSLRQGLGWCRNPLPTRMTNSLTESYKEITNPELSLNPKP